MPPVSSAIEKTHGVRARVREAKVFIFVEGEAEWFTEPVLPLARAGEPLAETGECGNLAAEFGRGGQAVLVSDARRIGRIRPDPWRLRPIGGSRCALARAAGKRTDQEQAGKTGRFHRSEVSFHTQEKHMFLPLLVVQEEFVLVVIASIDAHFAEHIFNGRPKGGQELIDAIPRS